MLDNLTEWNKSEKIMLIGAKSILYVLHQKHNYSIYLLYSFSSPITKVYS